MPERLEDLLFALEEQFWVKGSDYYESHLADAAMMVFPDPAGVQIKDEILSSVAGASRWTDVSLEEHRVMELSSGAALVTYKATARRAGEPKPYRARAASAYVHDGRRWKLAFHQQTPLP
jgi:ketosteroid isomerase-like protein